MNIRLAENIKALRKERKMTQEQLAEALGVTVGAVHKWESRASMPEIRMLMEIADIFCVSVDMLLGYEMKSSGAEDIVERITDFLRAKDFDSALAESEKALIRYPNIFSIVCISAEAYERKGVETGCRDALMRAAELMERSIPLLSQNDDPQISEVTIRSDIAVCYIELGQLDKGIEILKKYNAGGINNSLLGLTCSQTEHFVPEDTEKYLVAGLSDVVTNAIRCMSGYINYYIRREQIDSAVEAAQWLIQFLSSLKADDETICYFDRIIAAVQALSASFNLYLGKQAEAEKQLIDAFRKASAFDASPRYDASAVKFCFSGAFKSTASDDLGETAMGAIEKLLTYDERCVPALELWHRLKNEHFYDAKEKITNE